MSPVFKVRLTPGSKRPAGETRDISSNPDVHQKWISDGYNIGLMLRENGIVAVDVDSGLDSARNLYREHPQIFTHFSVTRRGVHLVCSGQIEKTYSFQVGELHGEVRGNGHIMIPPSVCDGVQRRWVKQGELLPFSAIQHLFPPKEITRHITRDVKNAMRYVMEVESIQGSDGSRGLVRAAAICRDGGMSEAEAMCVLLEWNKSSKVNPPWSSEELARAITRIYRKAKT